ncbi:diguanylate cyclase [Sulfuricurvum sp.]|uniref:diguanylate cyclase domain-containing protein n=1 Tax=Sulfuricurvum sp. TaxID=2025608 RepID=UPI002619C733|nr:diguanylate cyclase [Sulfuricurvum sp.]MDD2780728.1 diguanylate cyclase [Sulfuricurvum sp.]
MHYFFALILLFFIPISLHANHTEIHFGVFAYLGKEETARKYQPLADYLSETTGKKIILEVLTQEEMNEKVSRNELDILTTNPTHFLVLRQQYAFSGAIATLVGYSKGVATSELAGVIVVRADSPIHSISELKAKRIATPSTKHMGGFRAQAYELYKHGINLQSNPSNIIETKGSHQEVVQTVLKHKADVGFIRDGILEEMIEKGEIKANDIRVINEQNTTHPYIVSTRLYPEWPVCALPTIDDDDLKLIVSALFTIQPIHKELLDAGIYGYTMPADYLEVEQLARELRLPPFDQTPSISYRDIWNQFALSIAIIGLLITLLILYFLRERFLKKTLKENEERFRLLIENMNSGVAIYNATEDGKDFIFKTINPSAMRIDQISYDQVIGKKVSEVFPGAEAMGVMDTFRRVYKTGKSEHFPISFYQDGKIAGWRENFIYKLPNGEVVAVYNDVTEQMQTRVELEKAKSDLEKANQSLLIKNDQLKELAMIDGLTKIANRRLFDESYEKKYRETLRSKKSLAILMIDVDNFKAYNDHYGHAAGDECLIEIAASLKSSLKRPTDIVARYGGEEFVILLKDIELKGAKKVANTLLENIRALNIVHEYSDAASYVTVSIGLAFQEPQDFITKEELLKQADDALYKAKANGRNQIFMVGQSR